MHAIPVPASCCDGTPSIYEALPSRSTNHQPFGLSNFNTQYLPNLCKKICVYCAVTTCGDCDEKLADQWQKRQARRRKDSGQSLAINLPEGICSLSRMVTRIAIRVAIRMAIRVASRMAIRVASRKPAERWILNTGKPPLPMFSRGHRQRGLSGSASLPETH